MNMFKDAKFAMVMYVIAASVLISGIIWYVFKNHEQNANVDLASSCETSGGVLIVGVNDDGNRVNRFSVCVPQEAFICIDVE